MIITSVIIIKIFIIAVINAIIATNIIFFIFGFDFGRELQTSHFDPQRQVAEGDSGKSYASEGYLHASSDH